jgi:hypothetical protein
MVFDVPNDNVKNAADIYIQKIVNILNYDERSKNIIDLFIISTKDRNFSSPFSFTESKIIV